MQGASALQTQAEFLASNLLQLLSVVGMGNIDHRSRSLAQRLSIQVRNAVLRHDVADMRTGGHYTRALLQEAYDLAVSLLGGRGHGDDGLSTLAARRSVDEVHLAAEAAEDLRTDGVADHLTGDVDLDRGVHGHHLRHLGDYERVVREAHVADQHRGVVVHELVARHEPLNAQLRLLRSHDEAGGGTARVHRLLPVNLTILPYELVRDGTRLNQVNHTITEHLAVHAEALVPLQVRHDSVGNHANARLQRGAVLDEIVGNQLADLVLDLVLRCTL